MKHTREQISKTLLSIACNAYEKSIIEENDVMNELGDFRQDHLFIKGIYNAYPEILQEINRKEPSFEHRTAFVSPGTFGAAIDLIYKSPANNDLWRGVAKK